ncbi:MAG: tRNA-binding protein [Patescibacteria group bacterium]
MDTITYEDFLKVDMRLGRIIEVEDFPEAHKPAFKLKIDFGDEVGIKTSSVQLPGAYEKEELNGKLVVGVVNFPPKKIGPFISEVLTLGFANTAGGGFILAVPEKEAVKIGDRLR